MKPMIEMHTHTFLSSCCHDENANLKTYVDKAAETGVQVLGISDHFWDHPRMTCPDPWYQKQNLPHVMKIKEELPVDTKGMKLFFGVETEYYGKSDLIGISAEAAKEFDYVLIPHSHTHMKKRVIDYDPILQNTEKEIERRLREAFPEVSDRQIEKWMSQNRLPDVKAVLGREPETDLEFLADFLCKSFVGLMENEELQKVREVTNVFVAHPFIACGYSWQDARKATAMISDEKFKEMFTLMAEKGIGYDISVGNFDLEHPESCQMFRLIRLAKECGVKFTFGTDAHSVAGVGNAWKSTKIYELAPLTPEDLHPMFREYVK